MIRLLALSLLLTFSTPLAFGQAQIVPEGDVEAAKEKDVQGWNPLLGLNGSINLVSNQNVVGQVEGLSMLFGLGATGGVDYIKGNKVWRTTLTINESFAKTPVVDSVVKTNDVVALETIYNHFLAKKLGAFARAEIGTTLFDAKAVTADPVDYLIRDQNMVVTPVTTDKLKVADAFKPFSLNESVGAFAEPLATKLATIRVRLGLGGRHTFASGVLVEDDDDTTPQIEVQELTDVHQLGVEGFVGLEGSAQKGRVKYEAGGSLLYPFVNNDEFDRSATDLIRIGLVGKAQVSVFDWMAVAYQLAFTVDPQLFPRDQELTQIQNNVLLTFQYNIVEKREAESAPSELEEMKAAKEAAEAAARAAEARAKELEEKLKEATDKSDSP